MARAVIPQDRAAAGSAAAGVDADTLIRTVLFIGGFLVAWIGFHPYPSLAEPPPQVVGGDPANRYGYSALFLALAGWTAFHQPGRLKLLVGPALLGLLAWCGLSVIFSWAPMEAARHLAFTLVVMSIAGMSLLLPKNGRHFSDLLAAVVLIVLLACYLGVFLIPQNAVHQATDFLEPEHAGEWRGVFPHKNNAGAAMVVFIFIGLYVARMRSLALGGLIVLLSAIFLLRAGSKTALAVLPLALVLADIVDYSRKPMASVVLVVTILGLFNLFSVGTVIFEPVHSLVSLVLPDASFTGRTDIWKLGVQAVAQRPVTGYGFGSFFGTAQVVYGMGDNSSWVNAATDAHNAYLNLALTIGLPGLMLAVLWVVVLPILDFNRAAATHDPQTKALQTLFLRVGLYAVFASCFESSILQQVGEVWFFCTVAIFGLRFLALTSMRA